MNKFRAQHKIYFHFDFFASKISLLALLMGCFLGTKAYSIMPQPFIYYKRPIDSLCFSQINKEISSINLKNCGLKKAGYLLQGQHQDLAKQGYIGYNWNDATNTVQGYSYYKFFQAKEDLYWLETVNNSGGNGEFTAIYLVERSDRDTITIKNTLSSGDRCNGGLSQISLNKQILTYSVDLTAYDLIKLAPPSTIKELKAYDDLAACAVCCVARAIYSATPEGQQLQYIDLNNFQNPKELPQQGSQQACLNQLLSTYQASGKSQLTPKELNTLADQFYKECLDRK